MNLILKIVILQFFFLVSECQMEDDTPRCDSYISPNLFPVQKYDTNGNLFMDNVRTLNCNDGFVIFENFFDTLIRQQSDRIYYTDVIFFMNSHFQTIPELTFHELPNLKEIYLNATGITLLEAGCFLGLKSLKILQLDDNYIKEIEKGMLGNLPNLTTLSLSNNHLHTIHKDSFNGLINLQSLFLDGNYLQVLSENLFSPLSKIQTINLSRNYLETLNSTTFYNLIELQYLYINNNKLKHLPSYLFRDLSKLILLDVSTNFLTNITSEVLSGLDELTHLNISHNQLTILRAKDLYFLSNLKELNAAYNNISYLNTDDLTIFLPNLKQVYLHGNNWTCSMLFSIIKAFRITDVHVKPGKNYQKGNINGIACSGSYNSSSTPLTIRNGGLPTHEIDESRFLQNNHILLEIAGKISDNNNLMEQLIHSNLNSSKSIQIIAENVQKNAINAGSSTISHSPNQNMSNSMERTNDLLQNILNELRTERITNHSKINDDPTQLNSVNQQPPLFNQNVPPAQSNLEITKFMNNMKTEMELSRTIMKNISQAIISLQAKSNEPAILQNANNQIISEPLQRNSSASKAGDGNIGSNLEMTNFMTSTKPELELSRTMLETFMKNMSQTIASIRAKSNEPAIPQNYHSQIISEPLQSNPSVVNSGHGNIGLIVTLTVVVVILIMILGIVYIRYKNGLFGGLRRCRLNRPVGNRSETDLMANSRTLSNSEV